MKYNYYYNTIPEAGKVRNNLIYTSLINEDQTVFVKWFHNDSEYHMGMNEVVDPELMESKWERELKYITLMNDFYPEHIPVILDINLSEKKIYFQIEGADFWQQHYDRNCSYEQVLPDWEDQMLDIIQSHKDLDLYKYSMHPSSYFVVDGKLKSINYFFCHRIEEGPLVLSDYKSHIYSTRQELMQEHIKKIGISWDQPTDQNVLQKLCFDSFRTNYPAEFIEKAKAIYD